MTSGGRTPFSSASESGPGGPTPGRTHSQALPGLADRQDSANYQPRPPALAERQDSAQNLQVCSSLLKILEGTFTECNIAILLKVQDKRLYRSLACFDLRSASLSSTNSQAMAEAEAELTRTGSSGEATAPARQDSAHELDESARSPTSPEPSQSYASG